MFAPYYRAEKEPRLYVLEKRSVLNGAYLRPNSQEDRHSRAVWIPAFANDGLPGRLGLSKTHSGLPYFSNALINPDSSQPAR